MCGRSRPFRWLEIVPIGKLVSLMLVFFSNRVGCLGSLLISLIATVVLLVVLGVLR